MTFLRSFLQDAYRAWMRFCRALAWVNSRILLTALYIVLVGPYALLWRLTQITRSREAPRTFWMERIREAPTLATLRRLF